MLDSKGNMYIEEDDIIELMLANRYVKILPKKSNNFERFEAECKRHGISNHFELETNTDTSTWNMPNEYRQLNVRDFILSKHKLNIEQIARLDMELVEYEKRNLLDLIRFLIYFIDVVKQNNVIYGVGRGSSVSSYVLYLIGIHRIDSFKYNLDIKEFLR